MPTDNERLIHEIENETPDDIPEDAKVTMSYKTYASLRNRFNDLESYIKQSIGREPLERVIAELEDQYFEDLGVMHLNGICFRTNNLLSSDNLIKAVAIANYVGDLLQKLDGYFDLLKGEKKND